MSSGTVLNPNEAVRDSAPPGGGGGGEADVWLARIALALDTE
jgi:hypothetical protein